MKKAFIKTAVLFTLIILITSCKKGDTGPAGATGAAGGPIMTGNIEGLINLYDAGGVKQYGAAANTGDSITLTNNSNGMVYKTTTNSSGNYTFSNITSGTYSFTVSKPGYGNTKAFGFEFVGGGTVYKNFNLAQVPTTNVTTAVTTTVSGAVQVNFTIPSSTEQTYVITYVSSNSSVNGTFGNYATYLSTVVSSGTTTYSYSSPVSNLYNYGFTSGSTIYLATYIYGQISSYTDPLSGLIIYTALSSTPITTSVIIP